MAKKKNKKKKKGKNKTTYIETSSKISITEIIQMVGFPFIMILGLAVTWGSLHSEIGRLQQQSEISTVDHENVIQLIGNVNQLEGRVLKIEKWQNEWIARVLPLDADQTANITDLQRRIIRLESIKDKQVEQAILGNE